MFNTPAKSTRSRLNPNSISLGSTSVKKSALARRKGAEVRSTLNSPLLSSSNLVMTPATVAPEYLLQSNNLSVIKISSIPAAASLDTSIFSANLDPSSGFVLLARSSHLWIWNVRNTILSPIRLDMPHFDGSKTPIVASINSVGTKHGLVAINSSGLFRIWANINLPKQFVELEINLDRQAMVYFVGLANGAIVRLEISDSASYSFLRRNTAAMSFFGGFFSSAADTLTAPTVFQGNQELVKILTSGESERSLYICSKISLQKWSIAQEAAEDTFLWEAALDPLVSRCIESGPGHSTTVIGMDYSRNTNITLLVRCDFRSEESCYIVLTLQEDPDPIRPPRIGSFRVIVAAVSPRDYNPCFAISNLGVAFISLSDRVIITPFAGGDWEEVVPFKARDLVGIGSEKEVEHYTSDQNGIRALVCSTGFGILEVKFLPPKLRPEMKQLSNSELPQLMINNLLSKLEQIVFFNEEENPIALSLQLNGVDFNQPALELSLSILNATNSHLPNIYDESVFLVESFHRSHEIIVALSKNNLIERISEATRTELLFNTEKINVMKELWAYQNLVYLKGSITKEEECFGFLERCITLFLAKKKIDISIRAFFRSCASSLPEFFEFMQHHLQEILNQQPELDYLWIRECTRILNIAYDVCYTYRFQNLGFYQLKAQEFGVEPWIAVLDMLGVLQKQFELSIKSIQHTKSSITVEEDKDGLIISSLLDGFCSLCRHILGSFRDLITVWKNCGVATRQIESLNERYRTIQENANSSLVAFGLEGEAFLLAESFQEFETLVKLTLESSEKEKRIKSYISRFGEEYAFVLYQALLHRGMTAELLELDLVNSDFLDRFLEKENLRHLKWIQDLKHGRYLTGSKNLWEMAQSERAIKKQGLALSISRLAYLATIEPDQIDSEDVENFMKPFDIAQDLISLHVVILDYLKEEISNQGGEMTFDYDELLKLIMENCYSSLEKKPALHSVIRYNVNELLRERKLSNIGLIDTITLMNKPSALLFSDSLKLHTEFSSFITNLIWRRAWLSTDWISIKKKSQNLSDAQLKDLVAETTIGQLSEKPDDFMDAFQIPQPTSIIYQEPPFQSFSELYPFLDPNDFEALQEELRMEHEMFKNVQKDVDLGVFLDGNI